MHCCVYRHYYSHLMQLFVILMTVNGDELCQFNCSRQLLYVYSSNCCKWIADKYVQSSVGKRILWGMPGKTNILFLPSWVLLFPFPWSISKQGFLQDLRSSMFNSTYHFRLFFCYPCIKFLIPFLLLETIE